MANEDVKLEEVELAENPGPRCACVLLLDTSGSMQGEKIRLLNDGLVAFREELMKDEAARKRVEVAVVTFGERVEVRHEFVTADSFQPPVLQAAGSTPMGAAILQALDLVESRKAVYKANGVPYYRPWAFLITDGEPTDEAVVEQAARRVQASDNDQAKRVAFFAVGVEGANMTRLSQVAVRAPVRLRGLDFREMFLWLSKSLGQVSRSATGAQVPLPPPSGWATT
jgi:uncharacterized protein YegL